MVIELQEIERNLKTSMINKLFFIAVGRVFYYNRSLLKKRTLLEHQQKRFSFEHLLNDDKNMNKLAFILLITSASCFAQVAEPNNTDQDQGSSQVKNIQAQKISGFYLDGALGSGELKQTRGSARSSTSARSFQLLAGYQFNHVVGLELAYTDFGNLEYNDLLFNIIPRRSEPTAFTGQLNLGYSFTNGIRPFWLIGASHIQLNQSQSLYDDDSHFALRSGLGIGYAPPALRGVAFMARWSADWFLVEYPALDPLKIPVPHTDLVSLRNISFGVSYKF